MPRKQKFISKTNSVSYQLVHRSQKDPLQADDSASKLVLKAMMPSSNLLRQQQKGKYDLEQLPKQQFQEFGNSEEIENPSEKLVDNAALYGVFFEDQNAYDYLQHMKTMGEDPSATYFASPMDAVKPKPNVTFVLPDEVLPSTLENKIGMLNLAAPTPAFDPDMDPSIREVLYALEDEEYVEDELEEDFFGALNSTQVPDQYSSMVQEAEESLEQWEKDHYRYKAQPEFESESEYSDEEESVGYQKTHFSMTSSAMFRNHNLTLLDDRFDKVLQDYSSDEDDSVHGELDNHGRLETIVEEFLEDTETIGRSNHVIPKRDSFQLLGSNPATDDILPRLMSRIDLENKDSQDYELYDEKKKLEWDVESVLSTYSNIYNHPTLITNISKSAPKIKLLGRNKMPVIVEDESSEEDSFAENRGVARNRKETSEEKRLRKLAIKEERQDRRKEKKVNKNAFKNEKLKQEKIWVKKQTETPIQHVF